MMNSCNGQTREPVVRPATQANRFYEGNAQRLSQEVDSFLALHRGSADSRRVAALIVPHAGYYYSGNVAASAYMALNPKQPYKRIFLLGPSHHEWLDGASVNTEADYYATPLGDVKVDRETAKKLTTDLADRTDSFSTTNYTNYTNLEAEKDSERVFFYRPEGEPLCDQQRLLALSDV